MESDIWRAEVSGRDRSRPPVKLIASTRADFNAHYSPDGSQVAFSSYRSGNAEIWVCNGDGSNPVQLTSLETAQARLAGFRMEGILSSIPKRKVS